VILTEPNRETTAARHLNFLGCETFLPILMRAHCHHVSGGRRWRVYRRPLFPGYLFVRSGCGGIDDLWFWVRLAAGVRERPFLMRDNQPAGIELEKIVELQQLERSINTSRSERLNFRVGDRVLVSDGAFTGLRATVHMLSDRARVQLLLDFLGRKARVTVAVDQIQAAA
jgi:transcription antitermination factor NusG